MKILIVGGSGLQIRCNGTKSGSNVTVGRSKRTPVEIAGNLVFGIPEGALPGGFSVSATKQVRFAKGNLQYANNGWRFAEHQYGYMDENSRATGWFWQVQPHCLAHLSSGITARL